MDKRPNLMAFIHLGNHTFYIVEEKEHDDPFRTILCFSIKKQPVRCAYITFMENADERANTKADFHMYHSRNACSLEHHEGVIALLQVLFIYTFQHYPHISSIEVCDETFIDAPNHPLITARRLLLGQKGWFEEHFEATLKEERDQTKMRFIRHPMTQERIRDLVPPDVIENPHWWSPERIKEVAHTIQPCLHFSLIRKYWTVSAAALQRKGIKLDIHPASTEESTMLQKRIKSARRNAILSYVSPHWL